MPWGEFTPQAPFTLWELCPQPVSRAWLQAMGADDPLGPQGCSSTLRGPTLLSLSPDLSVFVHLLSSGPRPRRRSGRLWLCDGQDVPSLGSKWSGAQTK